MPVGPGALCTLQDVRTALESQAGETARDDLLEALIDGASAVIMRETRREFAPAGATESTRRVAWWRTFGRSVLLEPWDLRSASAVIVNPGTSVETPAEVDVHVRPAPFTARDGVHTRLQFAGGFNPPASAAEDEFGAALVDVTGLWGWPSVPDDVRRAAVLTVCSWAQTDVAALALDPLSEPRGIAPPAPAQYAIPPAAWRILSAHMHRTAY